MTAAHPVLAPGRIGALALRNRVIKTATYEGMTPDGRVSDALVAHHAGMARSGVALTTVAYGAVAPDGRTFPTQLLLDDGARDGLARLADAVHAHGGAVSMQLAHCGGFSRNRDVTGGVPGGPSHALNAYGIASGMPRVRPLTAAEIEAIPGQFADAAARVVASGFDAVEVHLGHGYLLSQFLSPAMNRRRDAWGGDAERRMRLPLDVIRAVRAAVGAGVAVLVKLNLRDDVRGGLEPADAARVSVAACAAGADAIVPSGGLVSRTPFYLLRGEVPVREMAEVEEEPLQRWALRLAAPFWIRRYPYASMFLRDDARVVLGAVDKPVVLLGGVDSADAMRAALDDGFQFVAIGRALLADPDLIARIAAGDAFATRCDHCNRCVAEMDRDGVRCVK